MSPWGAAISALLYVAFLWVFIAWCAAGMPLRPVASRLPYWRLALGVCVVFLSLPAWAWIAAKIFSLLAR